MNAYEAGHREPVDEQALEELDLYANNTSELYPQKQAILRNIQRRIKNGTYDPSLAPKLWLYWVDNAAKMYASEFAERREWSRIFSPATREALAKRLARREFMELNAEQMNERLHTGEVRENRRPWPRPSAREDAGPHGALDWKQSGDSWVAETFGGAKYKLVPEADDRWHTWYQSGGHKEDLGVHGNLGAAMGAARRHQPRMSKAAEGPYVRKTEDEYVLQGKYAHGWEDLTAEKTWKEIKARRREYIENEGGKYRIVHHRVRKTPRSAPAASEARSSSVPLPLIRTTFSRMTPESVEQGDFSETGWIDEDGVSMVPYDEDMSAVDMAVKFLRYEGVVEASSTHFHKGIWYSTEWSVIDYGTGEEEERSFHLDGFTEEQEREIFNELFTKRGRNRASEDDQIYTHKGIGYELHKRYQGGRPGWIYVVHFTEGRKTAIHPYDTKAEARTAAKSFIDREAFGIREADERVPVIHEQTAVVSTTQSETTTVAVAQEDFATVSQAEQHAYTVGARFIAPFGKRKYYVFTPRKGKGYDKRLMFHKAGKWHISADKTIAKRLSRDSRAIRVSQTAKTIAKEGMGETSHARMTIAQAKNELRPLGIAIRRTDGDEFRVNFRGGDEATAYYTSDLADAVATGKDMAKRRGAEAAEAERSKRKVVGYIGDVNWIEYGGGPIYKARSYEYMLEYLEPSEEEGGPTTVYQVNLVKGIPWGDDKDIAKVAETMGQDPAELRKAFDSDDPLERAYAYQSWAGYFGWYELDSSPLTLSPSEINKRYFGTMQALKKLKRPHGYRWSASEARRRRLGRAREHGHLPARHRELTRSELFALERGMGQPTDVRQDVLDRLVARGLMRYAGPGRGETTEDGMDAVRRASGGAENKRRGRKRENLSGKPKSRANEASSHKLDTFCLAYVEAALWSSTDESRDDGGDPLDKNYSIKDIDSETLDTMRRDCADFQEQNEKLLAEAYDHERYDASYAGHDFWLSRNGHGAGYFDRDLGDVGDKLQNAAKAFGTFDLYVSDGKIHGSPLRKTGREASESPKKKSEKSDDPSAPMEGSCAVIVERGDGLAVIERSEGCQPTGIKLDTAEDVYKLLYKRAQRAGAEPFLCILLTTQGEMLGSPIEIARGQADRVAVDIEQVIMPAVNGAAAGARGAIYVHFHPSGGSEHARPSPADKRLAEDIRKAMKVACPSTEMADFVIICAPTKSGRGSYYSHSEKKVTQIDMN